jgi:nucleoside-diphosphate-sugar epimerase
MERPGQAEPQRRVAITGSTGFIARFIVEQLLERGCYVNATCRDLNDAAALAQLKRLPRARTHLSFFCVNLLDRELDETARACLRGCDALIHTATPIHIALGSERGLRPADVEREQLRPAVEGTERLLRAALAEGVAKVVLTCSTGCIKGRDEIDAARRGVRVADDVWTDEAYCIAKGQHYRRAKLLQERRAVEFCAAHGMALDRILPDIVLGPKRDSRLNFSHKVLLRYLDGSFEAAPRGIVGMVDVRDVATAHVRAAERLLRGDAGGGRFVMSVPYARCATLCDELRASFPWARGVPAPGRLAPGAYVRVPHIVETSPVEALIGASLRSRAVILAASVDALLAGGFLRRTRDAPSRL